MSKFDEMFPFYVVGAVFLFVVLFMGMAVKSEMDNPCVKHGPEYVLYYQQIGSGMYPVFTSDCLERAND